MKVLVDTCIWSLSLRRDSQVQAPCASELTKLIRDYRVQMIGPVRQEILSGIRSKERYDSLREHLRAFPDLPLTAEDHELAASYFNVCRQFGIQGSNTDFLICALGARHRMPIFTVDEDFRRFAQQLPIELYPEPLDGPSD